jgi:hypothetical protein
MDEDAFEPGAPETQLADTMTVLMGGGPLKQRGVTPCSRTIGCSSAISASTSCRHTPSAASSRARWPRRSSGVGRRGGPR